MRRLIPLFFLAALLVGLAVADAKRPNDVLIVFHDMQNLKPPSTGYWWSNF